MKRITRCLLDMLAVVVKMTAKLGAGSASSWGDYQAKLPDQLKEER